MTPLVYFVRHGQTDWNAALRFQGQHDVDVNDNGRSQARRNGKRLAEILDDPQCFDFVASPLRRTRETMEIIRGEIGLPPQGYRLEPRLVEVHFGDWQGLTVDEVETAFPGVAAEREADKWAFLPPGAGAESYDLLSARIAPWLSSIDRDTVCVTHGGVIRSIFMLTGAAARADAAAMDVPQDRILRWRDGRLDWL
ncbi:histidine phosphatase family protein [Aquibium sp. ELW1220]|uniref:histidine phosphatase family protein n=1 Tax=Aquibium sp. ELW1220 TaxID=2976766 RepID=UPI0025B0468A|nr:histidine phosphatase family protein [Aquibium sp. ELW1220]MDN2582702.1 histidine phosphatase family protein [Aquibium sp. ELW1220]